MQVEIGKIYDGKITGIIKFGAFVEIAPGVSGMVHISEVSSSFVSDISEHLKVNQEVKVKVISVADDGKISMSIKKAENDGEEKPKQRKSAQRPVAQAPTSPPPDDFWQQKSEPKSFEEMLNKFKQSSEEKIHDIKKSTEGKRGAGRRGTRG